MSSTDRLARAIGLYHPLLEADREQIIDAGLADDNDFEILKPPWDRDRDPPVYGYCGDRWTVEFRGGRPYLIEAIDVPSGTPGSEVAGAEEAFGLVIHLIEGMRKKPMSDARVAALREEGWADALRHADERDAERADGGGEGVTGEVGSCSEDDESDEDDATKGDEQ